MEKDFGLGLITSAHLAMLLRLDAADCANCAGISAVGVKIIFILAECASNCNPTFNAILYTLHSGSAARMLVEYFCNMIQ